MFQLARWRRPGRPGDERGPGPVRRIKSEETGGAFAARTLIDEQPPTHYFLLTYIDLTYIDAVVFPALGAPTA